MLEGQVGILSAKILKADEVLEVLDALKKSALFRADQYSYLLYPAKKLPGFLERNNVPPRLVESSSVLMTLINDQNTEIIEQDRNGKFHFNSSFRNVTDLKNAIEKMKIDSYKSLFTKKEERIIYNIYEAVFNHKKFTGRSGTFYGYEGLGSIYWHMVSKLLLAVYECSDTAIQQNENKEIIGRILEHFYEIYEGIGVHKSPSLYGAFPTDPYSHTPSNKGAQQPGMTGQVKEDILSRFGELGIRISDGQLSFDPCLLRASEFLTEKKEFIFHNIHGQVKRISLNPGMLAFMYCQVPIAYKISAHDKINIFYKDGTRDERDGWSLTTEESRLIFNRTDDIERVLVLITPSYLK